MKQRRKDTTRINRRCRKLEDLGFTIIHRDSNVGVPVGGIGEYIEVDFSAIDEDKFLEVALKRTFTMGIQKGRDNLRDEFKQMMKL